MNKKLKAGNTLPLLNLHLYNDAAVTITSKPEDYDWNLIVVYRGAHCPLCTKYLIQLNTLLPKFHELNIDVTAISADPLEKVEQHMKDVKPLFKVAYDLSIPEMKELGLYISKPRSVQETDREFSEPGLFVINEKNELQIIDLSNAPFVRPDLESLLMGLNFIRNPDNNYPIRGTYE